MKITACLCLPVLLVSANCYFLRRESEDVKLLSIAIKVIIEKVFDDSRVDFRIYGTNSGLPRLNDILSENQKVPIELKSFPQRESISRVIKESASMIIQSVIFWANSYK